MAYYLVIILRLFKQSYIKKIEYLQTTLIKLNLEQKILEEAYVEGGKYFMLEKNKLMLMNRKYFNVLIKSIRLGKTLVINGMLGRKTLR